MQNQIFKAEHIKKSFCHGKKIVLRDISLEAEPGECIGIIGANGCGKSTLLSILAGVLKADEGLISFGQNFSENTAVSKKRTRHIGYVPQENPLMEELSALDNLKLWYCDSPLSLKEELKNGVLFMLGIPDFLSVPVKHMSGGMKKRLSLGCSLAKAPEILLLDEPGAALDLPCKQQIEQYLQTYKKQGNILVIATHEEREISLCDKIYILKDGHLSFYSYDGNIHNLTKQLT